MFNFRAAALTGALFLVSGATAPDTVVRPTKFDYTMTTLSNGLQVVFLEDHSTPIVHLAIWYHVGSKDEKAGRTGFAHLFEHLMFKGSRNVRPDQHPSWITSVGGQANAFTDEDATVYWETVPAQYLPLVLWLEADRMASLDVSDAKFKTEREVVKEERRMRYENQPFGRLPEIIFDKAFKTHPYKHQTIGSMQDLESAAIADVRAFHSTYYVPNNATLVLVGDFDTKEARAQVEQYLGKVPRGKDVPRDIPKEPAHTTEERFTVTESWPLPAVVVSYHPEPVALRRLLLRIHRDPVDPIPHGEEGVAPLLHPQPQRTHDGSERRGAAQVDQKSVADVAGEDELRTDCEQPIEIGEPFGQGSVGRGVQSSDLDVRAG